MARAVDEAVLEKELQKNDSAVLKKAEKQAIEGKDLVLDPHGPGLVPETIWKKHKRGAEGNVPDYVSPYKREKK